MAVTPVPDDFPTITPYLIIENARACISFATEILGASIVDLTEMPDGSVGHAMLRIGDSRVMLAEARAPEWPAKPTSLYVYVEDVDATFRRGLEGGAKSVREPKDEFYGDRSAGRFDRPEHVVLAVLDEFDARGGVERESREGGAGDAHGVVELHECSPRCRWAHYAIQ